MISLNLLFSFIGGGGGVQATFQTVLLSFKKGINNSRGKYKRNECLINVCKSDKDLS